MQSFWWEFNSYPSSSLSSFKIITFSLFLCSLNKVCRGISLGYLSCLVSSELPGSVVWCLSLILFGNSLLLYLQAQWIFLWPSLLHWWVHSKHYLFLYSLFYFCFSTVYLFLVSIFIVLYFLYSLTLIEHFI